MEIFVCVEERLKMNIHEYVLDVYVYNRQIKDNLRLPSNFNRNREMLKTNKFHLSQQISQKS